MSAPDVQRAGTHFLHGDDAIAEGALAAGCRFFGGYPITPSTEVAERMARRLPEVGGTYIQMEDELAAIASLIGASWTGHRVMTATSGPGVSLMLENVGLAAFTETPLVICNVQRGGPSTGLPTAVSQSDMMQPRFGSHGDYEVIALCPWSAQEAFDLTIRAFNLADQYRVPVFLLTDAEVGHMHEKVVIPPWDSVERKPRKRPPGPPDPTFGAYTAGEDLIPPMPHIGEGYRLVVEGLTHDERGYPAMDATVHDGLVRRLMEKIHHHRHAIFDIEERRMEDADIVILSYGISARVALLAMEEARQKGLKVGMLRLRTIWPFPIEKIHELSKTIKGFVVPELNMGQIALEVQRHVVDRCPVRLVPHAGGDVHNPTQILAAIEEVAAGKLANRFQLAADECAHELIGRRR
ncbi:MAG: 2-oxoacid:acceptor oxidoreductase subunit alpha [Bradymonadaceae bacterium]